MNEMERLYLDDLRVGRRFTSGSYVMEAARIKEFAAEFDPQPFHLDEAAAEAKLLRSRLPAPNRSKESSRFEARCSIKAASRFTC